MKAVDRAKKILNEKIDEIAAEAKRHAQIDFDQHVLPLCASSDEKAARYALLKYTLNPIVWKALDAAYRSYALAMLDDHEESFT